MPNPRAHGTIYTQQYTGVEPQLGDMQGRTAQKQAPSQPNPPQVPIKEAEHREKVQAEQSRQKFHQLIEKQSEVLFQIKTVFPFDLFPDQLTIRPNKIEVILNQFFFTNQIESVPLQDIAHVKVERSPFFAKLSITNIRKRDTPIVLNFLMPHDAIKAKKLIEGLLVVQEAGADISTIDASKHVEELERLGSTLD